MILAASTDPTARAAHGASVILVVEDDVAVRNSLQFSLEAEGYPVRLFSDAGSLLAAADLPVRGCIVSDYHLPDSNGLDLIRALRKRGVALPAILMTSHPSAELRVSAEKAHVPIVEKPLFGDVLSAEIGAAMGRLS
jgi:two-component system response regulator FixJ